MKGERNHLFLFGFKSQEKQGMFRFNPVKNLFVFQLRTHSFNAVGKECPGSDKVDDPKLRDAILDLQRTLGSLEEELVARNTERPVRFGRMLPSNWEASVSF